jgi:hypothetical protein
VFVLTVKLCSLSLQLRRSSQTQNIKSRGSLLAPAQARRQLLSIALKPLPIAQEHPRVHQNTQQIIHPWLQALRTLKALDCLLKPTDLYKNIASVVMRIRIVGLKTNCSVIEI